MSQFSFECRMCWTVGAAALKEIKVDHLSAWKHSSNCTQTQQVFRSSFFFLFNVWIRVGKGIFFLSACFFDTRVLSSFGRRRYLRIHVRESLWIGPGCRLFLVKFFSCWRNFIWKWVNSHGHTHPDPVTWKTTDRLCRRTSILCVCVFPFFFFLYSAA